MLLLKLRHLVGVILTVFLCGYSVSANAGTLIYSCDTKIKLEKSKLTAVCVALENALKLSEPKMTLIHKLQVAPNNRLSKPELKLTVLKMPRSGIEGYLSWRSAGQSEFFSGVSTGVSVMDAKNTKILMGSFVEALLKNSEFQLSAN